MLETRNRAITIDWMTDVVWYLTVASSCPLLDALGQTSADMAVLFQAVAILDHYMTTKGTYTSTTTENMKPTASAALFIAYKMVCVHPPSVVDLARATQTSAAAIRGMESPVFAASCQHMCEPTFAEHLRSLMLDGTLVWPDIQDRALLLCERALLHHASQTTALAQKCAELAKKGCIAYPGEQYSDCDAAYARRGMPTPQRSLRKRSRAATE